MNSSSQALTMPSGLPDRHVAHGGDRLDGAERSVNDTRGLYYKTFYGRNLRIFVIS